MNERIRQLAVQAGGGLSCIAEPLEHPWKFSESELEKFAGLIVKDVLDEVLQAMDDGMDVYDTVADKFGVEE
jgi:hypothetical protein